MIVVITGPTGVGKTKLSIALAKQYHGIIVNCDAVQVYQELNIGSAKIKEEEKEGIPHFLLDFVLPSTPYTVYDYQKDARKILEENKDKTIIIVGGSGLYLKALLYDYQFKEKKNINYDGYSNEELYDFVLKKDENTNIHPNNRRRLISFLNREGKVVNSKPLYDAIYIGLTTPRDHLYSIINQRVEDMFSLGLQKEVETLFSKYPNAPILNQAIGYKEFKPFLENVCSIEEVKEKIKQNSRHYAKRQYTWFNHQMDITWFTTSYVDFSKTIEEVCSYIEKASK